MSTSTVLGPAAGGQGHGVEQSDSLSHNVIEGQKFHAEAKDRLDSAIAKLVTFQPIYGTVFLFVNKRQDRSLPTMGVGVIDRVNICLFYNPDFTMRLNEKELRAVLQHEALHILLHHLIRREHYDFQPIGFNVAADMAINCHLSNLPPGGFYPKTFELEDFQASEWYYDQLKQQAEKNGSGDGKGGGGIPFYVKNKNPNADSNGDHSKWGDCEDDVVKEKVRSIADAAIKEQGKKGWSNVNSALAEAIIKANKPIVNWKKEVRWFIQKMILSGRKLTRTRINRREQAVLRRRKEEHPDNELSNTYIQPGTKRDFKSKLLVAIDTSGSMSDDDIATCLGEVSGMCEHVDCHAVCFSCELYLPPVHVNTKFSTFKVEGRNGTNFEPPIRYAEENNYDGIIMLTDGICGIPELHRKDLRVLWGLVGYQGEFPTTYGKVIRIDLKKKG